CVLAAGRTMISLTSTSGGCPMANAMASAIADAGMARARYSRMASRACTSEIDSASSDSVTPGEMTLTLMSPDCSLRSPCEMAQTANLVAQYTAAVGSTSWAPMEARLMMCPLPWARITGRAALDAVKHATDVHVDHPVPFVDLVFRKGGQRHDTGVVDDHVHP